MNLLSTLLSSAAGSRPAHPAVEDAEGVWTYSELARRAGLLAAGLNTDGGEHGRRVGILLPKSRSAVGGLYGILWAGKAYVPLDVAAPVARLAYMIRDCRMTTLVTCAAQLARLTDRLSETSLRRVILLDEGEVPSEVRNTCPVPIVGWDELQRERPLAGPVEVEADGLAYILYTSGSTGDPKGVMISHRNALAFVEWACEETGVTEDDRLSSHAPFHFDLSIYDLYVAALARATVVLVPPGQSVFAAELARWIEIKRISVWYSVPSILVELLERGNVDRLDYQRLKTVVFAGEVFASKYLRRWMNRLPHAAWFNFFGPTETNVCTSYRVPAPPEGDAPVSIGRAASGDTIHLRDGAGDPVCEPGVEGEICVTGPTVALGYWNDDARTAAKFVTDRRLTGGDQTVYRTGDLACWDESANLVFRGRQDHMVKIRGYRIELGEIEAAAMGHESVRAVCAMAVSDDDSASRIRVWVSLQAGRELRGRDLEKHMSERLPRYMLPDQIHFIDALPKTSTGKIDRHALAQTVNDHA